MIREKNPRDQHLARSWGGWIVRHAQVVLVASLLLCALLIPLALTATQHTVPDGWLPDSATAVQVQELAAREFGRSNTTYYLLFTDPTGQMQAHDPAFVEQVQFSVRPLRAMAGVDSVLTWGTTRNDLLNTLLIADDGESSLAVVTLSAEPQNHFGTPEWLRESLASTELNVQLTGLPVVGEDFRIIGHNDLVRAELIALPITLVLLILIFRGFLPALIPVALAAGSMIITLAVMSLMGRYATINVFTVNTVTMLGLAVGIDYALVMVSRFREESHKAPVEDAIVTTVATAGKTVLTAGTTVAIGLSGLLFFDVPAATTTALLGALVVLIAIVLSLTVLPSALFLFAKHIVRADSPRNRTRILPKVERIRERRPILVAVACLTLIGILTLPVTELRPVSPGISNLPPGAESRSTAEIIRDDFSLTSISPVEVVVQPARGSMLEATNLQRYQDVTAQIAGMPGVLRVESLWGFMPPGFTARTLASSYILEPDLIVASQPFLTPSAALVTVIPDTSLTDEEAHNLVHDIRIQLDAHGVDGLDVMVGGAIGLDLDLLDHIQDRTPVVLTWVITLTAIALFIHLRSVLLPIKAILLNLASMGASFGMLVWIFQQGNLAWLVGAEATGTTVMLIPVLMFCFLFGLGMDFEIIMLSRIRESWLEHGNTTLAVRIGLERAAGIVTASALLMLTVFLAFAFSELDVVKALGIGLAIAVAIDATIVRLLLLPATMQLMGRANWWPSRR